MTAKKAQRLPSTETQASTKTTASPSDEPIADEIKVKGTIRGREFKIAPLPAAGEVKRYIFTSAQNNTYVHEGLWLNLLSLASYYDAELFVASYSYSKMMYGRKSVKRGTDSASDHDELWYDPQVIEHLRDEPIEIAPGLVWCGELNILPTAKNPLSALEAYNGRKSNVIPHAKIALASVAALDAEATKFNFTTGTVTQRNYIQKKIGLLAEQYHGYGALLVEVCDDGSWFARQLEATEDGLIRDLDLKVEHGEVTSGNPVEAVTPGDVHVCVLDPVVKETMWGEGGLIDTLKPKYQMLHDVLDQRARNHHDIKDPLKSYKKWRDNEESVSDECDEVAEFLWSEAHRDGSQMVIVPSNHHEALLRWLKEADIQKDPVNMSFYHRAWSALIDEDVEDIFEWALMRDDRLRMLADEGHLRFLKTDESFVVAGVELGQHGHLGINGARGNHRAFTKLGRPATTGHEHTCGIYLGNWVSGTCTFLRLSYTSGPGSWSHSHVIQHPEGPRQMITFWKGKWRA